MHAVPTALIPWLDPAAIIDWAGPWALVVVCFIVFAETGLFIGFFLPGDSLLVTAGIFAARGDFDIYVLNIVLIVAAIAGDATGFWTGKRAGQSLYSRPDSRFFNRDALNRAHQFYERHGGKTLIITRFMPILRTFTPFVAGVSAMNLARFQFFNVVGALIWIVSLTVAGYLFGNVPFIKQNLTLVILFIIVLSLLPAIIAWWKNRGGAQVRAD